MKKQSVLVCHLKHHPTITPPYICFLGHVNCHIHVMIRASLSCYLLKKFMRTSFLLPHPLSSCIRSIPLSPLQHEGLRSNQNRARIDVSTSLRALRKLLAGQQKVALHPQRGKGRSTPLLPAQAGDSQRVNKTGSRQSKLPGGGAMISIL